MRRIFLVLALLPVLGSAPGSARAQGVHADLLPASSQIDLGETVDLEITVAAPSDSFNTFDATISYDDSILTFIQLSPISLQEGPLMKNACGNRFHLFNETNGVITITDGLLCAGVHVAGPGVVYKLRFQAAVPGPAMTAVHVDTMHFAGHGAYIHPVTYNDAVITIGTVTGTPGGRTGPRPELRVAPNPFRGAATITFSPPVAGPARIEVFAVDGRRVSTLFDGPAEAEAVIRRTWDGRMENGARAPAGVYFVRAASPGAAPVARRIALLP